eukprot:2305774-Rhodomonas_salina.5
MLLPDGSGSSEILRLASVVQFPPYHELSSYAHSGTAKPSPVLTRCMLLPGRLKCRYKRKPMVLCSRYAMSGTDVAYAATRRDPTVGVRGWQLGAGVQVVCVAVC